MRKPLRPGTLVGRVEVREILGLSRQRVHALEDRLPRPVDVIEDHGAQPIWRRADIERFGEAHRAETEARRAKAAARARAKASIDPRQ